MRAPRCEREVTLITRVLAAAQLSGKQLREEKASQVVHCPGHLDAVRAFGAGSKASAGIVDQQIEALVALAVCRRQLMDLALPA